MKANVKKNKKSNDKLLKFRFKTEHRIALYKRIMSFLRSNFAIYVSLVKIKDRFEKKNDYRAVIIQQWLNRLAQGQSFSKALEGWVPTAELNLIAAGEQGQGLDNGLEEAIKFTTASKEIKGAIIGGATYPVILLMVVLGFIGMFSSQMAPAYMSILPVERWPEMGQVLYAISSFIVSFWLYILVGIAVIGFFIYTSIGHWTGSVREIFDKIPPWSIYKIYNSSSFLISLASMMRSGVDLRKSLVKIRDTSSPWMQLYVEKMIKNLNKGGKNFGDHLDVGLLDSETAGDVIDYAELGDFNKAVYTIGEDNLKNSVVNINKKMNLVRTLMIMMVGLSVGWIYMTNIELNGVVADSASSSTTSMIK